MAALSQDANGEKVEAATVEFGGSIANIGSLPITTLKSLASLLIASKVIV